MRKEYLPYYKPHIDHNDVQAVVKCLESGWLTTGPKVKEFEGAFASISGIQHAAAVNSCTAALQLGLVALGVGPGDEVIMPSLSFVAAAECVRSLGGEPVFCDVDKSSLCITPETIKPMLGPRTKVVIPMHYGGQPGGIPAIAKFLRPLGVSILEDAAHGVGTLDGGRWPGYYSDAAAYSFYATKNITTAEGGMLLTNRSELAEKVRVLSLHGMDRDAWRRYMKGGAWAYDVVDVGYKFNLSDVAAALGIAQLSKLSDIQARRDALAQLYIEKLALVPGIRPVTASPPGPDRHSWCVFAVQVDEDVTGISRDLLIEALRSSNIGTSVHFIPTHTFSAYQGAKRGNLDATDQIWRRLLSLPLYPSMTQGDLEDVVMALREAIDVAQARGLTSSANVPG